MTALREISILKQLDHPNIINFRNVFSKRNSLVFVTDFMDMDLRKYLDQKKTGLSPSLLKSYSLQLLCGVCYLHSNRVLHRDIKPPNLLINREGLLKICDFGLSRTFSIPPREYTQEVVTLWYRPVELLLGSTEYDTSVDVWSVGCIIAEMLTGSPLFQGDSEIDQLFRIFSILGSPNESNWPGVTNLPQYRLDFPENEAENLHEVLRTDDHLLVDLISQLLILNPNKRISAIRAIQHPYFDDISNELLEICLPKGVTR